MRHRLRGRKLGRSSSHRKAMFRNMAASLIRSVRVDEDDEQSPRVPGRIVTTLAKAKELRPFVERLVTMARKSIEHQRRSAEYATSATRNSDEWRSWRESEQWNRWNQSIAPAVAYRRRAFGILRNKEAVDILFKELADRFADRPGGYTRVVRLADVRLGDSGQQALIEFVGVRDRTKSTKRAPLATDKLEADSVVDSESRTQEPGHGTVDEAAEEEAATESVAETDAVDSSDADVDNAESQG